MKSWSARCIHRSPVGKDSSHTSRPQCSNRPAHSRSGTGRMVRCKEGNSRVVIIATTSRRIFGRITGNRHRGPKGGAQGPCRARSARTIASGSASMTRGNIDAGPEGRRRPRSYCCTLSSMKQKLRANCVCVSPSLARRARTWSGGGGGYTGSAPANSSSVRAGRIICLAANSSITNPSRAARTHSSRETRSARKHWRALHDLHGPMPPGRHFWHMPSRSHLVVSPTHPLPT
jgi:hypothetical protein